MYLDSPRLVFSGDFQADVSTVNNDVRHYDVSTFEPRFQEPRSGSMLNGWWNPNGGATFQFVDCNVKQVVYQDGSVATDSSADAMVSKLVATADGRSAGKMVDLDPQMQMTSELWGIAIRFYSPDGGTLLEGDLLHTGFRDLQVRQFAEQGRNGQPLGATWSSILQNVRWGEPRQSRLLDELRESSEDETLSVQLNGFGYYYAHNDGRFSMARLLGVVGPYRSDEPKNFAPARRLIGLPGASGSQQFMFSNFHVNNRNLTVDLGMSFPLLDPLGKLQDVGRLRVAVAKNALTPQPSTAMTLPASDSTVVGTVDYSDANWLDRTAGIVSFQLNAADAAELSQHQLVLLGDGSGGNDQVLACETTNGLSVRADQNVQRIDPGETKSVDFYAYQWGKPLENANLTVSVARPSQSGGGSGPNQPTAPIPLNNHPADKLTFDANLQTPANGKVTLDITGAAPGNPRGYLDGQVYVLPYQLDGLPTSQQYSLDAVFVHLRDEFAIPATPVWDDIVEIMTQFGNLYPLMSRHIVDLANREAVLQHRKILLFAFTQKLEDPLYMPVTRDLSENKRKTIVKWLQSVSDNATEESSAQAVTTNAPTEPDPAEMQRPGLQMNRAQFEALTQGEGGKIDAFRGAADAFDLTEE